MWGLRLKHSFGIVQSGLIVLSLVFSACGSKTAPLDGYAQEPSPWPEAPSDFVPGTREKPNGCTDEAQGIVLLSADGGLYRLSPPKLALTTIGKMSCDSPLTSMSLARDGTFWGAGEDGLLYKSSGTGCESTGLNLRVKNEDRFGTGIVADENGRDHLFVAPIGLRPVGKDTFVSNVPELIDVTLGQRPHLRHVPYSLDTSNMEFAGTGDSRLFALSDPNLIVITQLDPSDGSTLEKHYISDLEYLGAYDFCYWQGDFYLFNSTSAGTSDVFRYRVSTRQLEPVGTVPIVVIGAESTTCAPL
ncbi:MAG TPA: hypothetical protein VFQ61_21325 [Polyangiaceae bacterium]|nr:hypothetical protein [Polyangiaceae bacterium]